MPRRLLPALVLLAVIAAATPSSARLTFSAASTDSTPASELDAVLDVLLDPADPTTLVIRLSNTSASFNVNELFFNATPKVSGLALVAAIHSDGGSDVASAWSLAVVGDTGNPTRAGGFGVFDFSLGRPVGQNHPALIGPGEWIDFRLAISGTGPFSAADFETEFTSGPIPSLAAAKFVNGPGDDSAFGNTVPEPSTALLVAAGLAATAAARRRRR